MLPRGLRLLFHSWLEEADCPVSQHQVDHAIKAWHTIAEEPKRVVIFPFFFFLQTDLLPYSL